MRAWLTITTFAMIGCGSGSAGSGSLPTGQAAAIDGVFQRYTEPGSPGCAVGVYRDDAIVFAKGYGLADLERNVPITPESIFDLGSTSKQFAAASIILLANDGKLALTDDVRKFVPEVPDYGTTITIDHLLRHTSGLRDYAGLLYLAGHDIIDATTDADALEIIASQRGLNFAPGTRWDYSNSGFFLLSTIVERVSGKNLRDFAQERIFGPLGMTRTHFRNDQSEIVPDRALGYGPREGGGYRIDLSGWSQIGDGGTQSSVVELLAWDRNFTDPKVGDTALIEKMVEPGLLLNGKAHGYGRGLFIDTYRGVERVQHGGAWAGYRAMLMRFPEQRTSIAVLCNVATAQTMTLAEDVADVVLADALQPAPPEPVAATDTGTTTAVGSPDRLVGMYYSEEARQVVRIGARGDTLTARLGETALPLRPTGPNRYSAGGFMTLEFQAGSGPADTLRTSPGGAAERRYHRVVAAQPDERALQTLAGAYHSPELNTTWKVGVDSGRLVISARVLGKTVLEPAMPDVFTGNGLIRFTRAGSRVTGFDLDAGRMLGIRFERRD